MVTTATSTNSLVVNPAFLQEIKDSNPDLWQAVHELRQTCESDDEPAKISRRIVRQLDDLRDLLSLQFALEESYGFIEVPAITDEQSSGDRAVEARSQHCSLYLQLSELAEQAEELQYRGVATEELNRLIDAARVFDAALRRHERLESDLIERAADRRRPRH